MGYAYGTENGREIGYGVEAWSKEDRKIEGPPDGEL